MTNRENVMRNRIRGLLPFVTIGAVLIGCAEEVEPPVYQMVPVSFRDIVVSASAAGTIEPVMTVDVKSKASGEITQVRVETGDPVARGDLLVRVDPRTPRNAMIQAEADSAVADAQLENSDSQLRRAEALFASQSITEEEYDAAKLARATAYASLIRAQRALEDARIAYEDTEVRAAASGVILEKNIEVGTVIASASRDVGGGAVLLKMANLDTVQIRTLVDETDIGKIRPGLDVTITVDAYPNQPFRGRVLKIEPQALIEQNVTMFPVLIRIENRDALLRPGMNAEVEVHVGAAQRALAIPNSALRTDRDIESAATVLGLDMETVGGQLAAGEGAQPDSERRVTLGGAAATEGPRGDPNQPNKEGSANTVSFRGRQVELPAGMTREQVQPVLAKISSGGFQNLTSGERAIMGRLRSAMGNPRSQRPQGNEYQFGGRYIVFVLRDDTPTAVRITTGLTDLDYSEVRSGLSEGDTVLVLPSASLIQSQREFQERIGRITGRGLPGVQRR